MPCRPLPCCHPSASACSQHPSLAPSALYSYLCASPSPDLPSASLEPPTIVCPQLHQHGMVTKSWHAELLPSRDVPSLVQASATVQVAPELCPQAVLTWVSSVLPHSCSAASCSLMHCSCSCQNPAPGEDVWPWVTLGGCRTQARQGGVFMVGPENG